MNTTKKNGWEPVTSATGYHKGKVSYHKGKVSFCNSHDGHWKKTLMVNELGNLIVLTIESSRDAMQLYGVMMVWTRVENSKQQQRFNFVMPYMWEFFTAVM